MKFSPIKNFSFAVGIAVMLGASHAIGSDGQPAVAMSAAQNIAELTKHPLGIKAVTALDLAFNQKNPDEAIKYFADPYIQHNPKAPNGIAAARLGLQAILKAFPEYRSEFKRVLVDGDLVAVHSHTRKDSNDRGQAVVDIFRFENGKIVEHWDVHEAVPESSANNNTMF